MKTEGCLLLLLLLLLWALPAEFTGLLVGRLTGSLFCLFNEQELLTGAGLSGGVRHLSGLFFFLYRSLDLAAHFKQDLVLRPVSVKGAMGGRHDSSNPLFLLIGVFKAVLLLPASQKRATKTFFFKVTTPNNAGQNCSRDVRADRNDARLQEIVPAGRQDLVT